MGQMTNPETTDRQSDEYKRYESVLDEIYKYQEHLLGESADFDK
jgi:hypothetical protein